MFRFHKVEVVHWDFWERFSLPLDADVITIVGPNGSGKTTLLDALRTLLCIDCSAGRDYKRYVRRSDKPLSWLRAVVDNERTDSGFRPFFPFLSEKVTLACQIRRKGGDWQRQYLLAEGDVPIENLEEHGTWIGVRDYRQRLEQAGLTQAIRHVLALEQGDTDKLCEYSARQLLELVFSVFGDQEVLDNYQQAKNEQMEIGRELEKLEEELARLGLRLREAEANVNSFREWRHLQAELERLSLEFLPRAELADAQDRILAARGPLRRKRAEMRARHKAFAALRESLEGLSAESAAARARESHLEQAEQAARESFERLRLAAHDAEKILRDKEELEARCREQQAGIDAPALAAEQRAKRAQLAANDHELKTLRSGLRDLRARLAALRAGEKIEPGFVQEFRRHLDEAGIAHRLLTEIIEVSDPAWQGALEGVLGPFAHIVLLADPRDRQRAWELGEKLRYRNFVVAERSAAPAAMPGSLLDVVRFREAPPEWLVELLGRIRRVENVAEGEALPGEVAWVTREGYHRERRGGRYIGVEKGRYQFGEAARKNLIGDTEREIAALERREAQLTGENDALSKRIDAVQALLSGVDAALALAARAAEFARAEQEFPALAEQAQDAGARLADCGAKLRQAREERHRLEKQLSAQEASLREKEGELRREQGDLRAARRQQVDRVVEFRGRRRSLPVAWRGRAALVEVRGAYESAEAVRRDLQRLKERLNLGSWVTDEQVVAVKDKLQGDHAHLEEIIRARRIHHQRHLSATQEARESYINVLRATVRRYSRNVRSLGELAGIGVEVEPPHLINEDLALAQAGLNVKFNFDQKGLIGLNDGEASGGQQVMKSLILLIGLLMDESRSGGFVFIDEPFAHLDVFNIDKVGAFL
uniref:AAA family ATPase n=1 Tax=Geoalkalibacter sp. TaxID=3041440 RepID=UPI00272E5B44